MSYLTQLQTNNTNLQACIDKANALPEAGGSAIKTCTVTISASYSSYRFEAIGYTTVDNNGNLSAETVTVTSNETIIENVVCGSMLACLNGYGTASAAAGCEMLYRSNSYSYIFKIDNDPYVVLISASNSGGGSID